ncbi:MAG: prolipoprotein diacylglyceryl transferase [Anaerolineales bacterium]|nr:prolipoprotein diacylglyceryl transferase [Anaerolineales bacterium]
MFPALNLGPFVLPTTALTLIIGAFIVLTLAERAAAYLGLDVQAFSGLVTTGLLAGVVGARFTFVFLHWPAYQANLLGIFWPLNSGFSLIGGLIFGCAAMFFYGRFKQLPPGQTLDALAPVLVTGLMFVSLADFLGGPGYGTFTTLPWGITQFEIRRHPVQLYEIAGGAVALLTWWSLRTRREFAGQLFFVTMAVYCFGRLFIDTFRANAWLNQGWHVLQIICLVITILCLILLSRMPFSNEKLLQ